MAISKKMVIFDSAGYGVSPNGGIRAPRKILLIVRELRDGGGTMFFYKFVDVIDADVERKDAGIIQNIIAKLRGESVLRRGLSIGLFIIEKGHLIIDRCEPITGPKLSLVENRREIRGLAQINGGRQARLSPAFQCKKGDHHAQDKQQDNWHLFLHGGPH